MAFFYIDGHVHLSDPRFGTASQLDQIIESAEMLGVKRFVLGGVDPGEWERQKLIKNRHQGKIILVFGLHPWWIRDHQEPEIKEAFTRLKDQLVHARGLGETGLDFGAKGETKNKSLQIEYFKKQIELAQERSLPLVLHIVRAHDLALEILKSYAPFYFGGMVHSFSGIIGNAESYIALGFRISISGNITKKIGFNSLKNAVKSIDGEYLVLETDAPDQKPETWGGSFNEPSALISISRAVATLRGESHEDVLLRSADNLIKLFKIE